MGGTLDWVSSPPTFISPQLGEEETARAEEDPPTSTPKVQDLARSGCARQDRGQQCQSTQGRGQLCVRTSPAGTWPHTAAGWLRPRHPVLSYSTSPKPLASPFSVPALTLEHTDPQPSPPAQSARDPGRPHRFRSGRQCACAKARAAALPVKVLSSRDSNSQKPRRPARLEMT